MATFPEIQSDYNLKNLNTFGIQARCRYFCIINSENELQQLIETEIFRQNKFLILGGGSNILFKSDFDGLVIKNNILGTGILPGENGDFSVKAGGGENWNDFVLFTLQNGLGGLENLTYIPGTVGASPVQNIGAYGVEMKDRFKSLEAIELSTGIKRTFRKEECCFSYRCSIFKTELKNKYLITSVTFRLSKNNKPVISYKDITDEISRRQLKDPDPVSISGLVKYVRQNKLPEPSELGNAGSFFKNPVVTVERFESLKKEFPGIRGYIGIDGTVKLAAGWLIEQCGWKGKREGDVGTYSKQALILVNHGSASGEDIMAFAGKIRDSVSARFEVVLEFEVNVI